MTRDHADPLFTRYCSTGDPSVLGEVFDRTAPELARIARHLCGDRQAAEDAVQETFLIAIEKREDFDRNSPVMPWLLGILANLVRRRRQTDAVRSRSMHAAHTEHERNRRNEAVVDATENAVQRRELWVSLRAAIADLPEPYRGVLREHLELGRSAQSIAADRHCPSSTVRNQIRRGMVRLQQLLPAGIAGAAITVGLPAACLARVRQRIEAHARSLHWPTIAGTGIGVWLMRKHVVAFAVLVFLGLGMWSSLHVFITPGDLASESGGATGTREQTVGDDPATDPPREQLDSPGAADDPPDFAAGEAIAKVSWSHDGTPIPGVNVCWTRSPARPTQLAHRSVTDEDGLARIAGLEPGRWFAHAAIVAVEPFRIDRTGAGEVELILVEHGVMEGRVVDDRDAPLASADVFATGGWLVGLGRVAVTDAAGRFRYRSPGPNVGLFASKPGHGRSAVISHLSWPGEENRATLVLGRGARPLRGIVVDREGQPIAGARVGAEMPSPLSEGYVISFEVPEPPPTQTGVDGRFVIDNVLPGKVLYEVSATGFAAKQGEFAHPVAGGGELRIEMDRVATIVIRGAVRDSRGHPVAGAQIGVGDPKTSSRNTGTIVTSSAGGGFECTVVATPEIELFAEHVDHGLATTKMVLAPADPNRWDAVLDAGRKIVGRVVDEAGKPLSGWTVEATNVAGRNPLATRVRTNGEGRFRFLRCAEVPHTLLVTERPVLNEAVRAETTGVVPGRDVTLIVRKATAPTAYLEGHIVRPVGFEDQLVRVQVYTVSGNDALNSGVSPSGDFRFGPLSPGNYRINLCGSRSALGGGNILGPFWVGAGEVKHIGTHELPTPTVVRLHPTRTDGRPVRYLDVRWQREGGRAQSWTWTRGMPLFHHGFTPGHYTFECNGSDHLPVTRKLEVRARQIHEVHLSLQPARRCLFRLICKNGKAVPDRVEATLKRVPTDGREHAITLAWGELRRPLLPGTYRVDVRSGQGISGGREFVVDQVLGTERTVSIEVH